MARPRNHFRRGFTIVEATMSVVIVGVMLVASTGVFGNIAKMRAHQTESRLAYLLARQLMAEIMQCPFGESAGSLGPPSGQGRGAFDVVDAYAGYAASPPVSKAGVPLADYANWRQAVDVVYANIANPSGAPAAASTLKRVTVTLTAPTGRPYVLQGLRSKFGPYEIEPSVKTTYVTGVTVSVQGPTPGKTVHAGAHPLNVTTSQ